MATGTNNGNTREKSNRQGLSPLTGVMSELHKKVLLYHRINTMGEGSQVQSLLSSILVLFQGTCVLITPEEIIFLRLYLVKLFLQKVAQRDWRDGKEHWMFYQETYFDSQFHMIDDNHLEFHFQTIRQCFLIPLQANLPYT